MNEQNPLPHGPGPEIIFVYVAFTLWGLVLGLTIGWLIWG